MSGTCWVIVGGPDEYGDPCYDDPYTAEYAAAEYRREGLPGARVGRRDRVCLSAECDGCYSPLEDDEAVVHCQERADLDASLALMEWIVTDDGRTLCDACKVHPFRGGVPAESTHLPIPGDVPLFAIGGEP